MSEYLRPGSSDRSDGDPSVPRAIIHKQILDHAAQRPDASMEELANDISGVTVTTVERVLEEYGDPSAESESATSVSADTAPSTSDRAATDGGATSDSAASSGPDATSAETGPSTEHPSDDSEPELDPAALTDKQRETLRAIYERPEATQADLADELGVSGPTISQRVNSIEHFDWSNRHALVEPLFDSDEASERRSDDDDERGTNASDDRSANEMDESETGESEIDERETDRSETSESEMDRSETDGNESNPDESNTETVTYSEPSAASSPSASDSREDSADELARATDRQHEVDDATRATDRQDEAAQAADCRDEADGTTRDPVLAERIDELAGEIASLERDLETIRERESARGTDSSVLADPELAHKIVHACLQSDRITEDEELRLLREITSNGAPTSED